MYLPLDESSSAGPTTAKGKPTALPMNEDLTFLEPVDQANVRRQSTRLRQRGTSTAGGPTPPDMSPVQAAKAVVSTVATDARISEETLKATATNPAANDKIGAVAKQLFTRSTLRQAIANRRKDGASALVIANGKVYDLTKFMKHHPGGELAIRHMIGRDATDTLDAFHPKSLLDQKLKYFYIGEYLDVEGDEDEHEDVVTLPTDVGMGTVPFDSKEPLMTSETPLSVAYRQLHEELRQRGFYKPDYWFYLRRAALFAGLLAFAIHSVATHGDHTPTLITAAFVFAFIWHGLSFTSHDAGHHSVTCNRKIDDAVGILCASFVGGLSIGWWKHNHNVHHIVTNEPEHDPDIQHMPFFAVSTRFFQGLYSTYYKRVMEYDRAAKVLISMQHYLYYPVMTFGRFNLYAQSLLFLLNFRTNDGRSNRKWELLGMATFFTWFYYGLVWCSIPTWTQRLMFVYISHAATFLLHVQITLSHFAMSTETPEEHELFATKAVRTTMNVDCPQWFDWFHGGLQFQVEHHLFPRIPRCHFRKLAVITQQFCKDHGLDYHIYSFSRGNRIITGALAKVAKQVEFS